MWRKIRIRVRPALAAVALAIVLSGCATQPVQQAPPLANISAEVALECKRFVDSWNAGDLDAFVAVYATTATFALADTFLIGREAIRDFYRPNFESGAIRDELALEQLEVEVLSPDAVLVRGIYRSSQYGEVTRRGTTSLILRRVFGQWQIVHDHSS